MGNIKINIGSIVGSKDQISGAENRVSSVKSLISHVRNQTDARILSRNNISGKFNSLSSQLSSIESKMQRIKTTVENGANKYYSTDIKLQSDETKLNGKIVKLGYGAVGMATGTELDLENKKIKSKDNSDDSTFEKILKDDWKLEGAVLSGSATAEGSLLGIKTSGTAEGDLIGGSVKTKSSAKWKPEKGEAGIEKSIEAEGHLAQGSLSGNIGLLGGEIKGTVGSVGATGAVGATLFKDGKLSPALKAEVKAEAAVAKGEAGASFGKEDVVDVHAKASGTVLGAEAKASGAAGVITYKDAATGSTKTEFGVSGEVGAEAYLAQGKISGGINVFGIKIDVGIKGKAGGAGVEAKGRATTGGISGEIGAGLGLGLGLEVSIDWSNFKFW